MEFGSIRHRSAFTDCYAINEDEIIVNLQTGPDVTAVQLIHDDPYAGGCTGLKPWKGQPAAMYPAWELKHHRIWSIRLKPEFKREQYYFSITAREETFLMFEDGFYTPEEADRPGRLRQYYKFPWLNAADVCAPPSWARDTVWYQIMPDRFCRGDMRKKRYPLRKWEDHRHIHFWDYYGGDLKGITEKLPYLQKLGITGIYMTPIFLSNSNHKYNTFDYDTIDPDFGTEEDLKVLVETAHSLGIRVMLDAVFNHSGTEFGPWSDVVKKGPDSRYWNWFFVNKWPLPKLIHGTQDGKFFSFAFTGMMPKLNTNNPEVIDYFVTRCKKWVESWNIDGIRFDVGNEVSHRFLKEINRELKAVKPDVFLLGEIWHDSIQWLQGDEYDSTMNYPFLESLQNFWLGEQTSHDLMYAMNRCFSLYPEQVSRVLFNFLDTHDTMRAITRCANEDDFYQQLTMLMTMPGCPCIYYGTEIALEGGDDPDCRRPMPWHRVQTGEWDHRIRECASLIQIRKAYPQLRSAHILWKHSSNHPRLICYGRTAEGASQVLTVCLNADTQPVPLAVSGPVLYSRKLENNTLLPGGAAILLTEKCQWMR